MQGTSPTRSQLVALNLVRDHREWVPVALRCGVSQPDKSAASAGNLAFSRTESGTALFGVDGSVRDRQSQQRTQVLKTIKRMNVNSLYGGKSSGCGLAQTLHDAVFEPQLGFNFTDTVDHLNHNLIQVHPKTLTHCHLPI
jgi:hypothetical protein